MDRCIILILSYIIGSIPFSLIATKIKGIDLKSIGSRNIGATNIFRTGKRRLAALALLLDSLKGFVAVYASQQLLSNNDLYIYIYLSAILAVSGHIFPVWLKFKGGKGVATTLGVLLALNVLASLIFIFTWVTVFYIFRYSSLSSLSATVITAIMSLFLHKNLFSTLLVIGILIFLKHDKNIMNLLQGKESKLL